MEMNEDGFLEELLALRREAWEANPSSTENHHNDQIHGLFSSSTTWASISSFDGLDSSLANTTLDHCSSFTPDFYTGHFEPGFSGPSPGLPDPEYMIENNNNNNNNSIMMACKAEHSISSAGELEMEIPSSSPSAATGSFNIGMCTEKRGVSKSKVKKVEGQPSKNLMAERRRRKRLNDRLSMLRSVVPKISKMDRTSILGDTIDYMKELLEKINSLQEETDLGSNKSLNLINIFKDAKPNDALVRNSPKFDVERSNLDTRVEICCAGKPSLLLSTVTTLEAMGLEIQQCVISCFNDFSLQASCSEEIEQKSVISSEDIKQALFRNAGYGGRCL